MYSTVFKILLDYLELKKYSVGKGIKIAYRNEIMEKIYFKLIRLAFKKNTKLRKHFKEELNHTKTIEGKDTILIPSKQMMEACIIEL